MNIIFVIYIITSIIFALILVRAIVIRWHELQKPLEQRQVEVLQKSKHGISFSGSFLIICFIVILLHFLGH